MAGDPYYRYASLERGTLERDPGSSVPGYFPHEGSALASRRLWSAENSRTTSSEFLRNDLLQPRLGGYTLDGHAGVVSKGVPGYVGLPAGAIVRGYDPLEDPALLRRDAALGIKPGLTDIERSEPFRKSEGLLVDESNVLFVDGLPRDCTRREVAHLFRPFIGFKEIRVIHKESRHENIRENKKSKGLKDPAKISKDERRLGEDHWSIVHRWNMSEKRVMFFALLNLMMPNVLSLHFKLFKATNSMTRNQKHRH